MPDRDTDALFAYLERRGPMPHEFGRKANDCVSFLDGAVEAQTGKSRLGRLTWKDERAGLKLLKAEGGVEAGLDKRFKRIAPAHAHRGDIGAIEHPSLGLHPMLVEGPTLCSPGRRGLKRCPRSAMVAAWSVMDAPDV